MLMYDSLELMCQGDMDFYTDAFPVKNEKHGTMMCIATPTGAIFVTRTQAAEFFGFNNFSVQDDNN